MAPSSLPDTMFRVTALYRFAALDAPQALRDELDAFCRDRRIRGTLLLAPEGINGTVAGPPDAVGALVARLEAEPALAGLEVKFAAAVEQPFRRLKVKVKREIVTMGVEKLDPRQSAGAYVSPRDWNALLDTPGIALVDTRNAYEVALGSFPGALDPGTESFGDFPAWAEANRAWLAARPVAMFCTGGIRCEKATAFLRQLGCGEVFHLKGGILRYLEEVPAAESRWQGECFVFDERVSVRAGLAPGEASLCRACRRPLTPAERRSPLFREGVSCPHCAGMRPAADTARFAERQRQVELAAQRGGAAHLPR